MFKIDFKNLFHQSKNLLERFPIGVTLSFFLCTLLWLNIGGILSSENEMFRIALSTIVAFFLSIGVSIFSENHIEKKLTGDLLQVISIAFGVWFYYSLGFDGFQGFEDITQFFLTLVCFLSVLFFAPYILNLWRGQYSEINFYAYFIKISYIFFMSVFIGGVVSLLGAIAIGSVDVLFNLSFDDLYAYWISLSVTVFAPIFALAHIPEKGHIRDGEILENKFFHFLVRYIGITFIYLYFIILYAYSLKVLLDFENWPKGEVSWMVIGFSIFGYLIYIFSFVLEQESIFVKWFRKFFPIIVLPQILMLFYAIYLRIVQYDVTVNRYFVVVFGIWLAIISLYYVFSKTKKMIFIPLSLSLTIIIISVGPWGVFSYPESRQFDRLVENLEKANILQNGKIVPLKTGAEISADLSEEIDDGIRYVCNFNNCERIKEFFFTDISLYETNVRAFTNSWEISNIISQKLKVAYEYRKYDDLSQSSLHFWTNKSSFPLEVMGYDFVVNMSNYDDNNEDFFAKINLNTKRLEIIKDKNILEGFDISDMITQIQKNHAENTTNKSIPYYALSGNVYDIKIIIQSYNFYTGTEKENKHDTDSVIGYVLLKLKK